MRLPAGNPGLKLRGHKHAVHFYEDDATLIEKIADHVGLGQGGSALVIATKEHRDALERRLTSRGFNTKSEPFRRRYQQYDAAEILAEFMVNGRPDAASFSQIMIHAVLKAKMASESLSLDVAAFGEMVALLWADGKTDAAIKLEKLWNDLAHSNSFSLLCAYPIQNCSDEENLSRICLQHSDVSSSCLRDLQQ